MLAEDPSVAADLGITAFADAGFFVTEEGRRVPQIILREEPSSLPNSIHSFLGQDRGSHSRRRSGRKAQHPFRSVAWHEQIQEALTAARGQSRAAILLEAARHLALGQDDRIARARSFADTASAFLRAWPACGAHLRPFLSFRLPPREAAELQLTRALVLAQPTNALSTGIF